MNTYKIFDCVTDHYKLTPHDAAMVGALLGARIPDEPSHTFSNVYPHQTILQEVRRLRVALDILRRNQKPKRSGAGGDRWGSMADDLVNGGSMHSIRSNNKVCLMN